MWYIEVEYDDGNNYMAIYDTRDEARSGRRRIYGQVEDSFRTDHPYTVKVSIPKKAD